MLNDLFNDICHYCFFSNSTDIFPSKKKKKGKERVLIVYCIFRMRITVLFEVIWGLKNIEGDVKKKKEEEIHVLEVTHFWTNLLWETVA